MKTGPESLTLRQVDAGDDNFLLQLYQSSRGDDLRGLGWEEDRISEFLKMQYEAQRNLLDNDYPHLTDQIVVLDGAPVGRLAVEHRPDEVRLVDVALLADYRNRQIGTYLIQQLQEQAAAAKLPLRLQVIRFNRAINLFERLGFSRTSETGTHFQMEWTG